MPQCVPLWVVAVWGKGFARSQTPTPIFNSLYIADCMRHGTKSTVHKRRVKQVTLMTSLRLQRMVGIA